MHVKVWVNYTVVSIVKRLLLMGFALHWSKPQGKKLKKAQSNS